MRYSVTDTSLTQIANAIRAARNSSSSLTYPTQFISEIEKIKLPVAQYKDVIFIDYDGTIRYSYTASEFASLTSLPPNPTHQGLIAEGWNWTLSDAKSVVSEYGYLTIGQNYRTDDGTTRIYIKIDQFNRSAYLGICIDGSVNIDWGDNTTSTITGTSTDNITYSSQHTYNNSGQYIIKLTITGTAFLKGEQNANQGSALYRYKTSTSNFNRRYVNAIKKIQIGANIARIQTSAFYGCRSLSSITIPKSLNHYAIGIYCFNECDNLKGIVFPSGITQLSDNALYTCSGLRYISVPMGLTTIGSNALSGERSLQQFYIKNTTTKLNGSVLKNTYCLSKIKLPSSLTTIGSGVFSACYSLSSITIPNTVTQIGNNAFSDCRGLKEIHFKSTVPPTLASSTVFGGLVSKSSSQPGTIIYVPTGYLTTYTSESNYPSSSSYTYVEE